MMFISTTQDLLLGSLLTSKPIFEGYLCHVTDMSAMMSFVIEIAILGLSPTFLMVGHYRTHTDPLFIKYNVLNVYDMYKLETGVFMYKYSKGSLPDGFNNFFITRSKIHDYHTRYKDHYHQTRNARTFSDHSIRTYGPVHCNSLGNNVKKSNSIKHFKNHYNTKLMCLYKCFWSHGVHCVHYVNL